MADEADIANDNIQAFTDRALAAHGAVNEDPQRIICGVVYCVDCDDPIEYARLESKPDACRCVLCQEDFEKRLKRDW